MKKLFVLVIALIISCGCFAQTEEEQPSVAADRPGMSTGTDVTPFLKVQWETGFESYFTDEPGVLLPTTMIRFGVTRFAELRLEYDGTLGRIDRRKWNYEVQPLILGTKVKVFDGYKWVPKISLMANLAIPLTREQLHETHVAPSLHLLFQNDVPTGSTSVTMSVPSGTASPPSPPPSSAYASVSTSPITSGPSSRATTISPSTR